MSSVVWQILVAANFLSPLKQCFYLIKDISDAYDNTTLLYG